MRNLVSLSLLALASMSFADKLITIPTGTKVRLNSFKLDGIWEQSRARNAYYSVGAGLTNAIDAFIVADKLDQRRVRTSLDLAYNFIPPITGIGPGVSFGVQDLLGVTRDGRRFFIAITSKEGFADSVNGSIPAEITIGGYFGRVNSPFVGVMIPFTDKVRTLAEYNGKRINAGVDIRPIPDLGIRAIFEQRDVLIGAQLTVRF